VLFILGKRKNGLRPAGRRQGRGKGKKRKLACPAGEKFLSGGKGGRDDQASLLDRGVENRDIRRGGEA